MVGAVFPELTCGNPIQQSARCKLQEGAVLAGKDGENTHQKLLTSLKEKINPKLPGCVWILMIRS